MTYLAITYECVCTIANVYPLPSLLEVAAQSIGAFLASKDPNITYLGTHDPLNDTSSFMYDRNESSSQDGSD